LIFQPPFPDSSEGLAIIQIGFLYFLVVLLIMAIVLMIYAWKIARDYVLVLIDWLFSIIFGFGMMENLGLLTESGVLFVLLLPVFFMVWQTTIMAIASTEFYNKRKRERE